MNAICILSYKDMSTEPDRREDREKDGWITFAKTVKLPVAERLANVHNLGCQHVDINSLKGRSVNWLHCAIQV